MPKINFSMNWLVPVATAVWALWTWAHERNRERDEERARLTALYVNPFLSAAENLQSRIYNILELGGLRSLQKRYPDGSYADETLYLIVRYFGWMVAVERHGPYSHDPVFIRLTSTVRGAFATSSSPEQVGPFNFFHPEQKALGKLVMHTVEGEHGVELDTISYYDFKDKLEEPPLSESDSVKETLEALRSAENADSLLGRERLAEVQNHLVDVVNYVEKKEGYTVFAGGQRKKCRMSKQLRSVAGGKKDFPALSSA